jgi:hypothetical protein
MPEIDSSPVILSFESLDTYPHERSARWYLFGGIFVLLFAAYGLFDGSWSTTLVALLIGGIYFLLRKQKPRMMNVQITGLGIQIDGTFTPWNLLKSFWIIAGKEHIELHIAPIRLLQPEILLFLNDTNPALVRETLLSFLPERAGMEERFLDSVARILKL